METHTTLLKSQNIFCTELYRYQGAPYNPCFRGPPRNQFIKPCQRESVSSAQQSRQGQSHGSSGTSITTKLRLRRISKPSEQLSLGNPAQIWILQGLVPEDTTLRGRRGSPGQSWRRVWWDGTVSISSPFTSPLQSHTAQGREGTGCLCCFFTNKKKKKARLGET